MSDIIKAPFTKFQVDKLNHYQQLGFVHEFTCGNKHDGNKILIATEDGWICPSCDYKQNWANKFMLNSSKLEENWNKFINDSF